MSFSREQVGHEIAEEETNWDEQVEDHLAEAPERAHTSEKVYTALGTNEERATEYHQYTPYTFDDTSSAEPYHYHQQNGPTTFRSNNFVNTPYAYLGAWPTNTTLSSAFSFAPMAPTAVFDPQIVGTGIHDLSGYQGILRETMPRQAILPEPLPATVQRHHPTTVNTDLQQQNRSVIAWEYTGDVDNISKHGEPVYLDRNLTRSTPARGYTKIEFKEYQRR
ncbi:hypothetical protein AOQ84DRAFT_362707 [Glonium stellatum]|uniref:Uncharacterized protein n=1 Tax=Glonium stellatum TaxID=574774 RepID=A0A8E2F3Y5_9PEZI|nr:hypothetical protein AOQ84DRAFT_362707 [Glonium stellatum]